MDISKAELVRRDIEGNEGRFVVEPLPRGYGHTLGNALRRMLLSALPGAALSAVRIEGAEHEYDILPNVAEDVADILMNLKRMSIRLVGSDSATMKLDVRGKRTVTAADFNIPASVDIPNLDHVIAHLTADDAELEMTATVTSGVGYVSVSSRDADEMPVGTLRLDAIYSPVVSAAYAINSIQQGERADLDRLTLTVKTDGSMSPEVVMVEAGKLLRQAFTRLMLVVDPSIAQELEEDASEVSGIESVLVMDIEALQFDTRTFNCLQQAEIMTIGDLAAKTEVELLGSPGIGKTAMQAIKEKLAEHDLELGWTPRQHGR